MVDLRSSSKLLFRLLIFILVFFSCCSLYKFCNNCSQNLSFDIMFLCCLWKWVFKYTEWNSFNQLRDENFSIIAGRVADILTLVRTWIFDFSIDTLLRLSFTLILLFSRSTIDAWTFSFFLPMTSNRINEINPFATQHTTFQNFRFCSTRSDKLKLLEKLWKTVHYFCKAN